MPTYDEAHTLTQANLHNALAALDIAERTEAHRLLQVESDNANRVRTLRAQVAHIEAQILTLTDPNPRAEEIRRRERAARKIATLSRKVADARYQLAAFDAVGNSTAMQQARHDHGQA